jgi:cysteine-rich repeat protein
VVKRSQKWALLAGLGLSVGQLLGAVANLAGCNAIAGIHEGILAPCGPDGCGGMGGDAQRGDASSAPPSTAATENESSSTGSASGLCGNGVIEPGEECDDQNSFANDGCTGCVVDCEGQGAFKDPGSHHCYWSGAFKLTFSQAAFTCKLKGGYLAAITSAAELDAVHAHVQGDVWLGGNDLVLEGDYVWSDGEPWSFTAWKLGEPSGDVDHHDCIKLTDTGPAFDDVDCDQKRASLCERTPIGQAP